MDSFKWICLVTCSSLFGCTGPAAEKPVVRCTHTSPHITFCIAKFNAPAWIKKSHIELFVNIPVPCLRRVDIDSGIVMAAFDDNLKIVTLPYSYFHVHRETL